MNIPFHIFHETHFSLKRVTAYGLKRVAYYLRTYNEIKISWFALQNANRSGMKSDNATIAKIDKTMEA